MNSRPLGTQCLEKKAFRVRLTALLFDHQAQWEPSPGKRIRRNLPWQTHQQDIFLELKLVLNSGALASEVRLLRVSSNYGHDQQCIYFTTKTHYEGV